MISFQLNCKTEMIGQSSKIDRTCKYIMDKMYYLLKYCEYNKKCNILKIGVYGAR